MGGTGSAVAAAAAFTWLGMVLAISFLEAPLKYRAPGITTRLGLGIGRIVFRALNRVEVALLVVVLVAAALGAPRVLVPAAALAVLLATQLLVVRPRLNRRSDRVVAGSRTADGGTIGLTGLLVLFVGIALLFTGRYPRGLFDLIVGVQRWVYRVAAYALLLTDAYPPVRLDQGGAEPGEPVPGPGPMPVAAPRTG